MTEEERTDLAQRSCYGGNPEHKRYPGDYGLMPPANPRPGKTLCDASERILKVEAERLLAEGIKKGMVSIQQRNGWPQNVWAISSTGMVLYPVMTISVKKSWKNGVGDKYVIVN
jgi:hypothetical protein